MGVFICPIAKKKQQQNNGSTEWKINKQMKTENMPTHNKITCTIPGLNNQF